MVTDILYLIAYVIINISFFAFILLCISTYFLLRPVKRINKPRLFCKKILVSSIVIIFVVNYSPLPKMVFYSLENKIKAKHTVAEIAKDVNLNEESALVFLGGSFSSVVEHRDDNYIGFNPAADRVIKLLLAIKNGYLDHTKIVFTGNATETKAVIILLRQNNIINENTSIPEINNNNFSFELIHNLFFIGAKNTEGHFADTMQIFITEYNIKNMVIATSAFHLPRAMKLSEIHLKDHNKLNIIPMATDYHTATKFNYHSFIYETFFSANNELAWKIAIKEYIALSYLSFK